jgi:hypothetical protein
MSVFTTLITDAVTPRLPGARHSRDPRCPLCGSFLDAPRVNPITGVLARKCATCHEWHPLQGGSFPRREE